MHCSAEVKDTCARNFYKAPTLEEATDRTNHVPKCKDCGAPMKPHCMFFDECYTECYYRSDSIRAIEEDKMDALIVVGTALATGGAKRLVMKTLERQTIPVIEINLEPCMKEGFALQITEKSEVSLDKMFKELYKLSGTPVKSSVTKNNLVQPVKPAKLPDKKVILNKIKPGPVKTK